jgi:hypothetical protein
MAPLSLNSWMTLLKSVGMTPEQTAFLCRDAPSEEEHELSKIALNRNHKARHLDSDEPRTQFHAQFVQEDPG